MASTDSRGVDYINRACERLLYHGKWKGSIVRYRVCLSSGCVVLPRQIETVEAWALCSTPGRVRGEWWEFMGSGPGISDEDACGDNLIQRQEVCVFDQVEGTGKKLQVYSDVTEAASSHIILQFYDNNAKWVRSEYPAAGTWIDGERLTLPAAGAYATTTNECMADGVVRVIKSRTNGTIRLYEYNPVSGVRKPLGYYEPDEEIPTYRSCMVPGVTNESSSGDGECASSAVIIQGKQRYMPVSNDNDLLQIEHMDAIRLGVQAVAKEEKDLFDDAARYWGMAFACLDSQLKHYQGDGATQPIMVEDRSVTGPGVLNLI